ncbi:deaminase [Endozoicomonas ascidiicola]|uniref:deaminase n=1 Tax=Endozoicomonas ascidiicola TaxID=1698521 RepID=UPI000829D870|nr:deaminase [Endozoicomonas ascidiicola]
MSDSVYMEMAHSLAKLSKCVRLQVGCLLVKGGRVLSTGVNGTPSGYVNCNDAEYEEHHTWSLRHEIHAELNAVIWAARLGTPIEGATAYVTHSPCDQCTKNLLAAGIKRIVYDIQYDRNPQEELSQFCRENGVAIEQVSIVAKNPDDSL